MLRLHPIMSGRRKTLEELANDGRYTFIDRNIAWTLLSQVDAQDGMKFAASYGVDSRFHSIVEVLREDTIWEFWMKRDLSIIYNGLNGRGSWNGDFSPEAPKWKTVYLWWRLVMTAYQWSIVRKYWNATGQRRRITRLNEIEDTYTNGTFFSDFRTEFAKSFQSYSLETIYNVGIAKGWRAVEGEFHKYIIDQFPEASKLASREYDAIISGFFACLMDKRYHVNGTLLFNPREFYTASDRHVTDVFSHPPRLAEETKLLVASCIVCAQPAHFQEDVPVSPPRYFCGKECQIEFY